MVEDEEGGYKYSAPDIDDLKSTRRDVLREECSLDILGFFQSSALGTAHSYDCRVEDQANIRMRQSAATIDLSARNIWAHDGVEFTRKAHTVSQLNQVLIDMEAHIELNQGNLEALIATVNACTTAEEVAAVVWV
jgi:hypothetical protein